MRLHLSPDHGLVGVGQSAEPEVKDSLFSQCRGTPRLLEGGHVVGTRRSKAAQRGAWRPARTLPPATWRCNSRWESKACWGSGQASAAARHPLTLQDLAPNVICRECPANAWRFSEAQHVMPSTSPCALRHVPCPFPGLPKDSVLP